MASKILHDKVFRSKGIDGSPLAPSSLRSIVETNEDEETPTNSKQDLRPEDEDDDVYRECGSVERSSLKLKPLPLTKGRFRKKDEVHEWEELLQQRLAEEVKNKELNKELQSMIDYKGQQTNGLDGGETDGAEGDSNWSTMEEQRVRRLLAEANDHRDAVTLDSAQVAAVSSETSTESPDDDRLYDIPIGIDRDAILFYKMQMARINSGKTGSLSSVQSDPMYASLEELAPKRVPSHSIEVLVRAIPNLTRAASAAEKRASIPVPPPPPPPPPLPRTVISEATAIANYREEEQSHLDSNEQMSMEKDNEILYSIVEKSSLSGDMPPPEANLAVPYITLPQSWANQPPLPPIPTVQGTTTSKEGGRKTPSQQSIIISYL